MRYIPLSLNYYSRLHIFIDQNVFDFLRTQPNTDAFLNPIYAEKFLLQVAEVFKTHESLHEAYSVYIERIYKLSNTENEFHFLVNTINASLFEITAIVPPDIKASARFESSSYEISKRTRRPVYFSEESLTDDKVENAYNQIKGKVKKYNDSVAHENFLASVPPRPIQFKANAAAIITDANRLEKLPLLEERFGMESGTLAQIQERVFSEKNKTNDLYFKVISDEATPVENLISELQKARLFFEGKEQFKAYFEKSASEIEVLLNHWEVFLRDFHLAMEKTVEEVKKYIQKPQAQIFQRMQEGNYGNSVEIAKYINELLLEAFYSAAYSYQHRLWRDNDLRLPIIEHIRDWMRVDEIGEVKSDSDSEDEEVKQENRIQIHAPVIESNHNLDEKTASSRRDAMTNKIMDKFGTILDDNGFGYLQLKKNLKTTLSIDEFKRTYLDPILEKCNNSRSLAWKKIASRLAMLTFEVEEGNKLPILAVTKKRNFVFSPFLLQLTDSQQYRFSKEDVQALVEKRTVFQAPISLVQEESNEYTVRIFESLDSIEKHLNENLEKFLLAIAKNRTNVERIKNGLKEKILEAVILKKWHPIAHLVPYLKIPRILSMERDTFLSDCNAVAKGLPNISLRDEIKNILSNIHDELMAINEFFISEEKISRELLVGGGGKESDGVLLLGQMLNFAGSNKKIPSGNLEAVSLFADKYADYVNASMQRLHTKWHHLQVLAQSIKKIELLAPLLVNFEAQLLHCQEQPAFKSISINTIESARDAVPQKLRVLNNIIAEIDAIRRNTAVCVSKPLADFSALVSRLPNFQHHSPINLLGEQLNNQLESIVNISSLPLILKENEKQAASQLISHIMMNALLSFDYWAMDAGVNRTAVIWQKKKYTIPNEIALLFNIFKENQTHFGEMRVLKKIQEKLSSLRKEHGSQFKVVQKFSYIEFLPLDKEMLTYEDALSFLHMLTDSNVLKSQAIAPINMTIFAKVEFSEIKLASSDVAAPGNFGIFGASSVDSSKAKRKKAKSVVKREIFFSDSSPYLEKAVPKPAAIQESPATPAEFRSASPSIQGK